MNAQGLGVAGGQFNSTTFQEVTTNQLRLEFDGNANYSTGIIEWRVYDSGRSPKFPPRVTAGIDRVVVLPGRTYLNGAVHGAAESVTWSRAAGPGEVAFADAHATQTTATFAQPGDKIAVTLHGQLQRIHAIEKIEATRGQVALRRGPLIYCFESVDQELDKTLPHDTPLELQWRGDLLGGVEVVTGAWSDGSPLLAIPYYARQNRPADPPGGRQRVRSSVWITEPRRQSLTYLSIAKNACDARV